MGKLWKQCQTLFLGAPKSLQMVTAAMELKDTYSLEGKLWPNLDSIFKSRDITLPTKVSLVKAMVFPVVMYGCESWTVKKAECWRIDAFELWCWRRLLRVPWTAMRSNQSILKEISPGCSLEGMMLKLKLQYLGTSCEELTHWKRLWCWEGLGAGGEGDDRGWDGLMASLTRWICVWVNSESWWWTGKPGVLQFMGSQSVGHNWVTEVNWTELKCMITLCLKNKVHALINTLLLKKNANHHLSLQWVIIFLQYNIKGHWSQITLTNIMKKFKILQELPKWATETQCKKMWLEKWCQ